MIQARFGTTRAGLILQKELSNPDIKNKPFVHLIGSIISELHDTINFIYNSPNRQVYEILYKAIKSDFMNRLLYTNVPDEIHSLFQTTVSGIIKQKRRLFLIERGNLGKGQIRKLKEEFQHHHDNFKKAQEQI